jgi:hypothetical protein
VAAKSNPLTFINLTIGVMGGIASPAQNTRRSELANLVADDDDFLNEFGSNVDKVKGTVSKPRNSKPVDHMEQLLQHSRSFMVKGRQHQFNEDDPIFFAREAYPGRKQFADCQSCDLEFEDTKSMFYCNFCGGANCKDCLEKTRNFFMDQNELMMQQMEAP